MIASFLPGASFGQEINVLPKYGSVQKTPGQKQADEVFIKGMDEQYHGDRSKAAEEVALRGWQYLQRGSPEDAMRRFNQAWLLNSKNATALWGMAAAQAELKKYDDSLKLFAEADQFESGNINFACDYARSVSLIGLERKDPALMGDAENRFRRIYENEPKNTRNLKNWAIFLYGMDRYADAWAKVKLAEAAGGKNSFDPNFLQSLQAKMPRPPD